MHCGGMVQNLIGCEVAADVYQLDVVYGIVTNYRAWNFYRSTKEGVYMEETVIGIDREGPCIDSLRDIIGKIVAMLSDCGRE